MYRSKYANLMQHLMNEHNLILLDSEQQEIEKWVDKDVNTKKCNWFEKLPLHWSFLLYYIGGIITGLLIVYTYNIC